jgi:hypothetical protein
MPRLAFTPDGTTLLHSTTDKGIAVWFIPTCKLRYSRLGMLVGVSRSGQTFLTQSSNSVDVWETHTGKQCSLDDVDPESYEPHQRTIVVADDIEMTLRVQDVLVPNRSAIVDVHYANNYNSRLDTWAVAPNNQDIIVVWYGNAAGHDWARGASIDIASNMKRYEFDVNRFQGLLC